MENSLAVPTATSVRAVPAKLLIDNRIVINNHLKRGRGGKISFTHLIGYAVVQALNAVGASANLTLNVFDARSIPLYRQAKLESESVARGTANDIRLLTFEVGDAYLLTLGSQQVVEAALRRLTERLDSAARPRRPRAPTRPTPASVRRRLETKRRRAGIKAARRRPGADE